MDKLQNFNGFNKEGLTFLEKLSKNNNRDWFESNKSLFKDVLEPDSKNFTLSLKASLEKLLNKPIKSKIFRIYRDVRFSKDKTPYNTHIRIAFYLEENPNGPALMLSLEPDQSLIMGCGIFEFSKSDIEIYRQNITTNTKKQNLDKILNDIKNNQYRVDMPSYKKIPKEYVDQYPQEELLKAKGLTVWKESNLPKEFFSKDAIEFSLTQYKQMLPLHSWLNFKQ